MERTIGNGVQDIDGAREVLRAATVAHGAQAELARRCGVITPYINRLLRQSGARPSVALRAALERELGIPAAAWSVERWTWERARETLACLVAEEPHPGRTADRIGVSRESLADLIAGRATAAGEVAARIELVARIPAGAWPAAG